MRLLPFTAAADEVRLTGLGRRSLAPDRRSGGIQFQADATAITGIE